MAVRDVAAPSSRKSPPSGDRTPSSRAPKENTELAKRYRTLFTIGRGGMGSVEAALARGAPGEGGAPARVVALKRLLPDAAREQRRVDMFLREAKLAAMLDHPNVVRAFDYGEIDGELFLAMEYVEGQPLSRLLRSLVEEGAPPLDPALAAYVLAEVCEGLHAAHELRGADGQPLGLVHRDVSPQNVMIGYDGHVRLLDFGVAKIEAESQTKTGEVKGKTAYMSPEQAMGDAIDRRSDLFGVGAVLFECLALRRMWGDGTDMEVIRKLALDSPPSLEEATPSAPAAMRVLYTKLVARDAVERPATAEEVATALRAFVPQGRDWAARAMAAILDKHFGAQAAQQRAKLRAALDDVAPDQPPIDVARAHAIRESFAPERRTSTPPPRSARPSAPSEVKAVPAPPAPRSKAPLALGAIALAAVGVFVARGWGSTASTDAPRSTPSTSAAPPAPPVSAPASASASTTAPPAIEPSRSAPPRATSAAPPASSASAKPPKKRAPKPPSPSPSPSKPSTAAPPASTAAPSATAPPLDVDPNAIP